MYTRSLSTTGEARNTPPCGSLKVQLTCSEPTRAGFDSADGWVCAAVRSAFCRYAGQCREQLQSRIERNIAEISFMRFMVRLLAGPNLHHAQLHGSAARLNRQLFTRGH